ncbi:hypothetical protein GCM10017608_15070 [Agromyces luteolus]|nr:M23 family metallopeptidase [Agromyces luteolus]GLK27573.1 hypothetical protein GCM10017608_15070 [Agromyces luteolus]
MTIVPGDAVVIDFPLRGEGWLAVTTPAARVPSHGTDLLGQRYAYDFVRVDARPGRHEHPGSPWRVAAAGAVTSEFHAWGAPIHAPFDGEVVAASDGMAERDRVHPLREAARAARTAATFAPERIPEIMGNHVILRAQHERGPGGRDVFCGVAHLVPGSVAVAAGDRVRAGDLLGRVGHTGNSTSPHLHIQLMDSTDLMSARGLPLAFRGYEVERGGTWVGVDAGVPALGERIRSRPPPA